MDTVCGACQRFLTQYLTTANCLSIRQFAEQHNCVSLMSSVDDFAMEHFPVYFTKIIEYLCFNQFINCHCMLVQELRVLPGFMRIPFGHLVDLLRSSDLKVNNEQEVIFLSIKIEFHCTTNFARKERMNILRFWEKCLYSSLFQRRSWI